MAEETTEVKANPETTIEMLAAKYQQLCMLAGDKTYRIHCLKGEIDVLHTQMLALNQESHAMNQAKKEVVQ